MVIDVSGPSDVIVADVSTCAPATGTNTATDAAIIEIERATVATRPRPWNNTRMRTPDVRPAPARAARNVRSVRHAGPVIGRMFRRVVCARRYERHGRPRCSSVVARELSAQSVGTTATRRRELA